MFAQRRRRWINIDLALDHCRVFICMNQQYANIKPAKSPDKSHLLPALSFCAQRDKAHLFPILFRLSQK